MGDANILGLFSSIYHPYHEIRSYNVTWPNFIIIIQFVKILEDLWTSDVLTSPSSRATAYFAPALGCQKAQICTALLFTLCKSVRQSTNEIIDI